MNEIAPTSSLDTLLSRNADRLTATDSRLLKVLLQDPMRAAIENGKEISDRAGVHPASAVRLAQRLGFDGYPAFRAFLCANLTEGGRDFGTASARMAARLVRAEEGGLLASVIRGEIASLERLRLMVTDADIRTFSNRLCEARRIYLLGQGHAASLSRLVALRLKRSGYDARDLDAERGAMAMALRGLAPADVVWLFSFRAPHAAILSLADLAHSQNATVLALTDEASAPIWPAPHHLIRVSRGEAGEPQSLTVPMAVVNAVILDLAGIDDGRSLAALEEYRKFRSKLPPDWN
ncbi:RpiR family transcriptional regulator [Primorskyibacter sedentarius]|uniref:RpiR family transcriptional regulator n=1 Tax=Primorskyibacter sedentarius TaxID=745311 RepID=A0A4R3INS6_9RHOB|nr:MurR/RpiR family transcriptional regulator [Primorskyibacter sedentarius]TCS51606.1 RpiR family transcriptional regulator [Primorskyibacter sedentarius]